MLLSRTFGQTSAHLYRGFPALPIPVQLSNIYRHRQTNTLTWCCYTRTCDSCWTTARNPLHTHTQTHTHTRTHTVSVQFLIMSIIWLLHIQPVTPHACGARKKALGRAVYDKFVNVYSWNSLKFSEIRNTNIQTRHSGRQCGGPCAVSQPHDFLEIGNYAPFSEFLHIKGRHFPEFPPLQVYVWPPWTMIRFMKIGLHVFPKSGTQTHRQTSQLYIYRYDLMTNSMKFMQQTTSTSTAADSSVCN